MDGRVRILMRIAVAAAILATATGLGTAAAGAGSERDARPRAVGVRTKTFVDRSRATPADVPAGIPPSPRRTLDTTIYYPARGSGRDGVAQSGAQPARGKHPLVLFAPGSPGTPADYEILLADWAAHGYVVVALQFPISSVAGPDNVAWKDLRAQTKDVRYVLGEVLDLDPGRARIPEIDADRIAVAGHSFGGATALSLVSKCCRDHRIAAAVILAGVTETVAGPKLRNVRGPLLFVHGRNDRAVSYTEMLDACQAARPPKRLLTVEELRGLRAHTLPFLGDDAYSEVVRPAIVDFLDGYLRQKEAARERLEQAGEGTAVGAVTRCPPPGELAASPPTRTATLGPQDSRVTSRASLSVRRPL